MLVGATNLLDSNESTKQSVQRIIMDLDEIRVHPQYQPHSFSNDVAILVFKNPVSLTKPPNTKQACLPFQTSIYDLEGSTWYISGVGRVGWQKPATSELKKVDVKILCKNIEQSKGQTMS